VYAITAEFTLKTVPQTESTTTVAKKTTTPAQTTTTATTNAQETRIRLVERGICLIAALRTVLHILSLKCIEATTFTVQSHVTSSVT